MDSRLLAGAYSKRYKYIEREEIETLKTLNDPVRNDVLAKARRLSQETNKRRKYAAQKRKQEAAREEKRRQEILNKRHQEQKQATEKYQRCHVGTRPRHSPRHSPRRHGSSPPRGHMDLEDALHAVRGSSSSPNEQSRNAIQRMYQQQNTRDPLERSYIRASRISSANQGEGRQNHSRPQSGRPLDASMRSELMERSLRNMTSSRSRFEQQLEHHQQLLMEQQQKSLRDFNQAIRREIDSDTKVQGVEENEEDSLPLRSESLSSLDSLEQEEDENKLSLSNSQQDHQALKEFNRMAEQQKDTRQMLNDVGGGDSALNGHARKFGAEAGYSPPQERAPRPQSAKVPVSREQHDPQRHTGGQNQGDRAPVMGVTSNSHVIGPIPQGYYTPPSGTPPSSTPVIQGNLSYYPDSLDASQSSPERRVTVGTALRLPQQPSPASAQPIKHPPPTLQYNSQLLAHRKFENPPTPSGLGTGSKHANDNTNCVEKNVQQRNGMPNNPPTSQPLTSALTQDEPPSERPKAHIYAWSSPPPVESELDQSCAPPANEHLDKQASNSGNSSYSASIVADRVMATNLHPQTSRSISTAATTTFVYHTLNSSPHREQANNNSNTSASKTGTSMHTEIPRGQGQKPGTSLSSAGTYPSTTGLKFGTSTPSFHGQPHSSDNRQQGHAHFQDHPNSSHGHTGSVREHGGSTHQQQRGGSITQGTLGLVNGRLTIMDYSQPENAHYEQKITVVEDPTEAHREVRGILKRANKDTTPKPTAGGQTKFNVHDSVEIAKKHLQHNAEFKKKKVKKKGVRFADLCYGDEVDEDTDSTDSMTDVTAAASTTAAKTGGSGGGKATDSSTKSALQRPRPASARAASITPKSADSNKLKGPRVASAGPTRQPAATRPKAAAHIIMSGDANSHPGHHGSESAGAGITVHKSQLEKKVMLINNNFMSRIPMYTSAASSTAATMAPTSMASVYSVSSGRNGTIATHPTSSAATENHSTSTVNGYSRSMTYSQAGDQTKGAGGKSTVPTPHTATILPSHSHFSQANNTHKLIYDENGMRIDRTPTDDEINNLWKNMRTMLDVGDGNGKGTPPASTNINSNNSDQAGRQQVQVSHQYIDGASLGIPNNVGRVMPGYNKPSPLVANGVQAGQPRAGGATKNGYLQRYTLLQQRRNTGSGMGASSRTSGVVEQTLQPMPLNSNGSDPRHAAVNISYAPREEMSESMAGFLAAEQMVNTQGADVRDSRVAAAIDSAQNQQEMYNSIRQKVAKGGPSALSMEEHRLLESLDKLNERLKVVESRPTNNGHQAGSFTKTPGSHQIYVHGSGFRGHQVIASQAHRRNAGSGLRSMGRPVSARLLTRPYH